MNVMVFFICFSLKKLDLGLGLALELFAISTIICFRTDSIPVKEMTYLSRGSILTIRAVPRNFFDA